MEGTDTRRVRFLEVNFESSSSSSSSNNDNNNKCSNNNHNNNRDTSLRQNLSLNSQILSDENLEINSTKDACTPTINRVLYRNPEDRASVSVAPPSSITRPNYEDILRRVSVVIHQHISKCELKLSTMSAEKAASETEVLRASKVLAFSEENYTSPQYVYHFVRAPISRLGFLYGIRKVNKHWNTPGLSEVHTFLRDLFVKAQLSAECSIGKYAALLLMKVCILKVFMYF